MYFPIISIKLSQNNYQIITEALKKDAPSIIKPATCINIEKKMLRKSIEMFIFIRSLFDLRIIQPLRQTSPPIIFSSIQIKLFSHVNNKTKTNKDKKARVKTYFRNSFSLIYSLRAAFLIFLLLVLN